MQLHDWFDVSLGVPQGVVEVRIDGDQYLAVGQHEPKEKPSIHFYNMQSGELAHKTQLKGNIPLCIF